MSDKKFLFPVNRKELYKSTFKFHFLLIMKLSLIVFCFAIPLACANIFLNVVSSSILNQEEITREVIQKYYSTKMILSTLYIPSIFILLLGIGGSFFALKKYCWNEISSFIRDIFSSLKSNFVEIMKLAIFYSILIFICIFSMSYLAVLYTDFYLLFDIIKFIILLLVTISIYYSFTMISIYKNSFGKTLKNSFLYTIYKLPKNFLILLVSFVPLLLVIFFDSVIFTSIIYLLYAFIGFGNSLLIIFLYCNEIYDETINKKDYPSIYHAGLFDKENEDAEDQ